MTYYQKLKMLVQHRQKVQHEIDRLLTEMLNIDRQMDDIVNELEEELNK